MKPHPKHTPTHRAGTGILAVLLALICWTVPSRAALVGHWTFEEGEERVDRIGNFPDLLLMGDAQVVEGALDVNGEGTTATGWAVSDSANGVYRGPVLTNKTLVVWVRLQSPPGRNGLTNMRRRVEAIGAGLRIETREEGGTRVTLEIGV